MKDEIEKFNRPEKNDKPTPTAADIVEHLRLILVDCDALKELEMYVDHIQLKFDKLRQRSGLQVNIGPEFAEKIVCGLSIYPQEWPTGFHWQRLSLYCADYGPI